MTNRRTFLQLSGQALLGTTAAAAAPGLTLPFANGERPLVQYPQKRPLIRQTTRPPQLETPAAVFNESILTPNDAFFVRYHHANIPTAIDLGRYRLTIQGRVQTPLSLTLADLRTEFPSVEVVAVNQCSGNSRGFFTPRVGGGQLGNGAMGNARWRGVTLKSVLAKAGLQPGAKQVTFKGLDEPVLPATPPFVKALTVDHALDGEVMLAYAMNDADLPLLNGYPLRLVVPGYFGTYWIKHLSEITVVDNEFDGFFMSKAYRIPATACACVAPGETPKATVPIGRYAVRSFLTSLEAGAAVRAGVPVLLRGIAFDGGTGIREVALSMNDGLSWQKAVLGADLGRYSFRAWHLSFTFPKKGDSTLLVRATSNGGETQPLAPLWNPPGYMRNVVERVGVRVI